MDERPDESVRFLTKNIKVSCPLIGQHNDCLSVLLSISFDSNLKRTRTEEGDDDDEEDEDDPPPSLVDDFADMSDDEEDDFAAAKERSRAAESDTELKKQSNRNMTDEAHWADVCSRERIQQGLNQKCMCGCLKNMRLGTVMECRVENMERSGEQRRISAKQSISSFWNAETSVRFCWLVQCLCS
jgi:hypothetical protein